MWDILRSSGNTADKVDSTVAVATGSRPPSIPSALQHIARERSRRALLFLTRRRGEGRGEKRAKERVYDVNWKRFLSCHGARTARYSLSLPSVHRPRPSPMHEPKCQRLFLPRSSSFALASSPSRGLRCPTSSNRRKCVRATASVGFARDAIGRTSSSPAICNPCGLILRGNDNFGTIRPPPPLLFSFYLAFHDADRPRFNSRILLGTFS